MRSYALFFIFLAAGVAYAALTPVVVAGTIHVPGDSTTIQAGIYGASSGDTVLVAAGTYNEWGLSIGSGVTLLGAGGMDSVTIDADGHSQAFSFSTRDSVRIEGFTITGAIQGAMQCSDCEGLTIDACHVTGNSATLNFLAAGINCTNNSSPTITDCVFSYNVGTSFSGAGALRCENSNSTVANCTFHDNSAAAFGGGVLSSGGTLDISFCTFYLNSITAGGSQHGGGGLYCYSTVPTIGNCTFYANQAPVEGGGIFLRSCSSEISLHNTVVAYSLGGGAIHYDSCPYLEIDCCDFYGNAGGDWGAIPDSIGLGKPGGGNISVSPFFCNADSADFGLARHDTSCAPHTPPNWECDLIGAWPVGCRDFSLWEGILPDTGITDIPGDQGGLVRVTWERHFYDSPETPITITEYSLWRRIDGSAPRGGGDGTPPVIAMHPPGDWEYMTTVPALGEPTYTTPCATLCDSTAGGGICWTALHVIAHTEDAMVFFESDPDSGYSVDNLEPEAPTGLVAQMTDSTTVELTWDANGEDDLKYYSVYRDTVPDFIPDTPIGYSAAPSYVDTEASDPETYFYKVTATDFAGNESQASLPASAAGTSVPGEGMPAPEAFFLGAAAPNPFNPITEITYGVPAGTEPSLVTLTVFDPVGRRVATLVDHPRGPGVYRVSWDGTDDAGEEVSSGVYFYRIRWRGVSQTRRMVLVK